VVYLLTLFLELITKDLDKCRGKNLVPLSAHEGTKGVVVEAGPLLQHISGVGAIV
jgi:hypothetical protein